MSEADITCTECGTEYDCMDNARDCPECGANTIEQILSQND